MVSEGREKEDEKGERLREKEKGNKSGEGE